MNGENGNVINCIFTNNVATESAGALGWERKGNGNIEKCTFTNNDAPIGGAIYQNSATNVSILNSIFESNTASKDGGAIYWDNGTEGKFSIYADNENITNCLFENNKAQEGGAIYFTDNNGIIIESNFTNNTANKESGYSGAIFFEGNNLNINQSEFSNNSAYGEGAIYAIGETVTISNSRFENNKAKSGIVAISADNSLIDECEFINNSAEVYVGVFNADGTMTISNSYFANNTAESSTRLIRNSLGNTIIISNCVFENNAGNEGNYSIDNNYGTIYLYNNTINTQSSEIHNYGGDILSPCTAIAIENKTISVDVGEKTILTAVIMDDNGNLIEEAFYVYFIINDESIESTYNPETSKYEAEYTFYNTGSVPIDIACPSINITVKKGTCDVGYATYVDLVNELNNCQNNTLELTKNYIYDPDRDSNYTDGIVIDKADFTVDGKGHTIDGAGLARIFNITANNVTLKNINFIDGNGETNGGAVYFNGTGTVINCEFHENYAECGGAIYAYSDLNVTDCKFTDNAAEYGGAILSENNTIVINSKFNENNAVSGGAIYSSNDIIVDNCQFNQNDADYGGAIYAYLDANVKNSEFIGNTADNGGAIVAINELFINKTKFNGNEADFGGAIFACNNTNIGDCEFYDNHAEYGGAVYFVQNGTVTNSSFALNTADYGGAIYNQFLLSVADSQFINNKAETGGAIYSNEYESTISNSAFKYNDAYEGGAIYNNASSLTVTDSEFASNSAKNNGGAIYNDEGDTYIINNTFASNSAKNNGGAIYNLGYVKISDSRFTDNDAKYGGAIDSYDDEIIIDNSQFENNNATKYGGAIYNENSEITIKNSNFTQNTAEYGGAIENRYYLNIDNSRFENNTADYGGAIDNDRGDITIANTDFTNNTAEEYGGAIYNDNAEVTILDSNFTQNTADYGGAIECSDGEMVIENSQFTNNMGNYHGGAIYIDDGDVTIASTDFINNTAECGGAVDNWGTATVINTQFTNNTAEKYGGAITNKGTITVTDSKFTNNDANTGAAIETEKNMTITNSEFLDNGEYCVNVESRAKLALNNVSSDAQLVNDTITMVIVEAKDVVCGDDVNIKVRVNSSVIYQLSTGKVVVKVNDVEYCADVIDGVGIIVIPELDVGTYNTTVAYIDNNLSRAVVPVNFTVKPIKVVPSVVIEGDFENLTVGSNVTFVVNVPDDATGYILAIFDGEKSFAEIEKGKVDLYIFELSAGEKNITVKYLGDDKYEAADNFTSFNVSKVEDYNMAISADGDNYKTVVDIELPDDADGDVVVTDDEGNNYNASVNDGVASVSIYDLPVGVNNLTVAYSGDDKYASKIKNTTINTPKADKMVTVLTAERLAMIVGDGSKLTAKLTDENNRPISGKAIKFSIVGKTYTIITNDEGIAELPIGLKSGFYSASVIFNGDSDFKASNNVSTSVEVLTYVRLDQNKDLVKDYHDDRKPFTVRALDKYGKPAGAGQYVKISVSGKTYTLKTDAKGVATLPINLYPGNYKITAEYAGYKVSNTITVNNVIYANNRQWKAGSSYNYFTATLKNSEGKVLVGKTVSFTVAGKTYKAVTNAKGQATVILSDLSVGKYTIQVKYIQYFIKRSITVK